MPTGPLATAGPVAGPVAEAWAGDAAEKSTLGKVLRFSNGAQHAAHTLTWSAMKLLALNALTLGTYSGYEVMSGAWQGYKADGIAGAINTVNPLYQIGRAGVDGYMAANHDDWEGVGEATTVGGAGRGDGRGCGGGRAGAGTRRGDGRGVSRRKRRGARRSEPLGAAGAPAWRLDNERGQDVVELFLVRQMAAHGGAGRAAGAGGGRAGVIPFAGDQQAIASVARSKRRPPRVAAPQRGPEVLVLSAAERAELMSLPPILLKELPALAALIKRLGPR